MIVKRYLLVEVNVGGEEGSDPEQSVPTVADWGAYKRLVEYLTRIEPRPSGAIKVEAVYTLEHTGLEAHTAGGQSRFIFKPGN